MVGLSFRAVSKNRNYCFELACPSFVHLALKEETRCLRGRRRGGGAEKETFQRSACSAAAAHHPPPQAVSPDQPTFGEE